MLMCDTVNTFTITIVIKYSTGVKGIYDNYKSIV